MRAKECYIKLPDGMTFHISKNIRYVTTHNNIKGRYKYVLVVSYYDTGDNEWSFIDESIRDECFNKISDTLCTLFEP